MLRVSLFAIRVEFRDIFSVGNKPSFENKTIINPFCERSNFHKFRFQHAGKQRGAGHDI